MRTPSAGRAPRLIFLGLLFAACATQPLGPEGDVYQPNARLGPFRPLVTAELGNSRPAPKVMDDRGWLPRDPAVLDVDGDPATLEVWGYFAVSEKPKDGSKPETTAPSTAIVRYHALDGRTFDRQAVTVLQPGEAWEGGTVGQPAVVRAAGEVRLYYAAKGGIGLARSKDGVVFTRASGPVLGPANGGWEGGAVPASPTVAALPDGSQRMFYEVAQPGGASALGEARSDDGLVWTRVGGVPALSPAPPSQDGSDPPWDDRAVGSPFALTGTTAEGRAVVRVYYGALDRQGHRVIGLAARFGTDGPLARAAAPVFGSGGNLAPHEPCVFVTPNFTLLFATERAGKGSLEDYPAVAAGVAPATATLPPPDPP